jgi:hypothetical protein
MVTNLTSGHCDICGAFGMEVKRTFINFPIVCECCHDETHHQKVDFCDNCVSKIHLKKIWLSISVEKLLDPIHENLFKKVL